MDLPAPPTKTRPVSDTSRKPPGPNEPHKTSPKPNMVVKTKHQGKKIEKAQASTNSLSEALGTEVASLSNSSEDVPVGQMPSRIRQQVGSANIQDRNQTQDMAPRILTAMTPTGIVYYTLVPQETSPVNSMNSMVQRQPSRLGTQDRGYSQNMPSSSCPTMAANRFPNTTLTSSQSTTYNLSFQQQVPTPTTQSRRVGNISTTTRHVTMATNSHLNNALSVHGYVSAKVMPTAQALNSSGAQLHFPAPNPDANTAASKRKMMSTNTAGSFGDHSLVYGTSDSDVEASNKLPSKKVRAGQGTITSATASPKLARSTIPPKSTTTAENYKKTASAVAGPASRVTKNTAPTKFTANAVTSRNVQDTARSVPSRPTHPDLMARPNGQRFGNSESVGLRAPARFAPAGSIRRDPMARGNIAALFQAVTRPDRPTLGRSASINFRIPAQSHPYPTARMSPSPDYNPTHPTGRRLDLNTTSSTLRREMHSNPAHYFDRVMNTAKVANVNNGQLFGPQAVDALLPSNHALLIRNFQLEFIPFSRLPIKIRTLIIEIAAKDSTPRIVTVSVIPQEQEHRLSGVCRRHIYKNDLLKTSSLTPPLMRTSSEIRTMALKVYHCISGERYGEPSIWFNFHADTLHVSDSHTWLVMFGMRLNRQLKCTSPQMENMIENLRYLTLGVSFMNDTQLDVQLLKQFPRLRVLTLQKMMDTMQSTMGSNFLGHLQGRRKLEEGYERFTEEGMIKGDYKKRGEMEKPVVLWRTAGVLNKLSEKYKNGIPTQAPKPNPEPLRFSQEWFNRVYDW